VLEPLGHEHAEGLVAALRDDRVDRYIPAPDVTTVEALHARILHLSRGPRSWLNFAIRRGDDGVVIGRLEATVHDDWAEIAYLLGPAYWGHGYGREAVAWLVEHLGGEVWAAVHPENAKSMALLAALGFVRSDPPARRLASYDDGDVVFVRLP
jgi:RimJ/RimL family protein N-acetyltransferase